MWIDSFPSWENPKPVAAEVRWHYDLFVAFAEADEKWVQGYLVPALGVPNERLLISRYFVPGAPLLEEFDRAVKESRFTAVVFSPAFLVDAWGSLGERLASHASVAGQANRVIPILAEPCELPLHIEFRVRLDFTDRGRWEQEAGRLRKLLQQPDPGPEEIACPYPGMVPFSADLANLFFGREDEVTKLVDKLRHQTSLFIIGPSGSGKSSLVFAGVIPGVTRSHGRDWVVRSLRPGATPERALTDALDGDESSRLLLVVDQLEEVFTQAPPGPRALFLARLNDLRADDGCVLVLTMRADFYPQLMASDLWPLRTGEREEIAPLRGDALRRAIAQPAAEVGVYLEPALVERLVADAADEPGLLPLVQETMVMLWDRRVRRLLTLQAYEELGRDGRSGLAVAMATMADATVASLSAAGRETARRIFLRLVEPGSGHQDTRRQQSLAGLRAVSDDETVFNEALARLTSRRLLTTGGDEEAGEQQTVDLAHEALIAGWPTLQQWLSEDRELLHAQHRLGEAAEDWHRAGRKHGLLYRADQLAAWRNRATRGLNQLEDAFLRASRRRLRRLKAAMITGVAIVSAVALVAVVGWYQVANERDLARSRQLAAVATSQLEVDPQRSLLLALESLDRASTPEAANAVRHATLASQERGELTERGILNSVAFSPDGRRVVTGSDDNGVEVWDWARRGSPRVLRGHDGPVNAAAFSPDGARVASASDDGTVRVWDAGGGGQVAVLRGHDGPVTAAAFSPDGARIVTAGDDQTVRVWEWASADEPTVLRGHTRQVRSAALSPDGSLVVSAGFDGTVRVWDWRQGIEMKVFRDHSSLVYSAAFSEDGRRVVTAGYDRTVRVWDWAGTAPSVVLRGHDDIVWSASFSPDGRRVVSASSDGTVRVWDWTASALAVVLRGHELIVTAASFSPDGQLVGSASFDGTVRIWDWASGAGPAVLRGHENHVSDAAFSSDGRHVATASVDFTVRVWDPGGDGAPVVLRGHGGGVRSVAFSPDGRWIASASLDGTVRAWDWAAGTTTAVLQGHEGNVASVSFSPDGRFLVSAGSDSTVRVWEWGGDTPPVVLRGHDKGVSGASFSPDGRWVVSGGEDLSVRVWDWARAGEAHVLRGHSSVVSQAAFSPDGRWIVTASWDDTVRVWDWSREREVKVLRGHQDDVNDVAFSSDGRWIVSGGRDGAVQVWQWPRPSAAFELGRHSSSVGSVAIRPDGGSVVTASNDGTVRIWSCETCGPMSGVLTLARQRTLRKLNILERETFLASTEEGAMSSIIAVPAAIAVLGLFSVGVVILGRRRPAARRTSVARPRDGPGPGMPA
jgi:WD40 repeat protein